MAVSGIVNLAMSFKIKGEAEAELPRMVRSADQDFRSTKTNVVGLKIAQWRNEGL
jgi:hypothetical protein